MGIIKFETIKQLVRALALSGQSDTVFYEGRSNDYMYDIDRDIHWNTEGQYLIVYIESYGSDNIYSYRIYRCCGDAVYDRRKVMDPALESDDCTCLFDLEEREGEITSLYLQNTEIWYKDYEKNIMMGERRNYGENNTCNREKKNM